MPGEQRGFGPNMAMRGKRRQATSPEAGATVFDRAHLVRYTMESPELEREIIALFLAQLPSTMAMLREAGSAPAWKLATHTLKGSAAAVGAKRINQLASDLELRQFDLNVKIKHELIVQLEKRAIRDGINGGHAAIGAIERGHAAFPRRARSPSRFSTARRNASPLASKSLN